MMAEDNKPKQLKKFKDAAKLLISLPVAGIAGLADGTDQNILLKSRLRVRGSSRSKLTTRPGNVIARVGWRDSNESTILRGKRASQWSSSKVSKPPDFAQKLTNLWQVVLTYVEKNYLHNQLH